MSTATMCLPRGCFYRVAHSPRVAMRAEPSLDAEIVHCAAGGEVLHVQAVLDSGWVRLEDDELRMRDIGSDAYMLIDGACMGFGRLLERLPCRTSATDGHWRPRDAARLLSGAAEEGGGAAGPRQFVQSHSMAGRPGSLAYVLTLPASMKAGSGLSKAARYPLVVYLHSAITGRSPQLYDVVHLVGTEAPLSALIEKGHTGKADDFIGLAPCCPVGLSSVTGSLAPTMWELQQKLYWFKACDADRYDVWDFSCAVRCHEMEVLVTDLLARVCEDLPVDSGRVYILGSSCGGYGALRLAELLPGLPAAVVPMAGYYPEMPDEDHEVAALVSSLQEVPCVWPLHCAADQLCRTDRPHVQALYELLRRERGVEVDWVPKAVAKGADGCCHQACRQVLADPEAFFANLLRHRRPAQRNAFAYLRARLARLLAEAGGGPDPAGALDARLFADLHESSPGELEGAGSPAAEPAAPRAPRASRWEALAKGAGGGPAPGGARR